MCTRSRGRYGRQARAARAPGRSDGAARKAPAGFLTRVVGIVVRWSGAVAQQAESTSRGIAQERETTRMPYAATFEGSTTLSRDKVFSRLADFVGLRKYFPEAVESVEFTGSGIGSERTIRMKGNDGVIVERLEALVDQRLISYSIINNAPLPLDRYHAVITLADDGAGCKISWSSNWVAKGASPHEVRDLLIGFYRDIFAGVVRAG
jgi:Polyketide cyclase / dehydrase and lipid transport